MAIVGRYSRQTDSQPKSVGLDHLALSLHSLNKAVIDRRLRPCAASRGVVTLSTRHSRVAVYAGDIMCIHDVMNIQHVHCGLVGSDRGARKVEP